MVRAQIVAPCADKSVIRALRTRSGACSTHFRRACAQFVTTQLVQLNDERRRFALLTVTDANVATLISRQPETTPFHATNETAETRHFCQLLRFLSPVSRRAVARLEAAGPNPSAVQRVTGNQAVDYKANSKRFAWIVDADFEGMKRVFEQRFDSAP